MPKSLQTVTCKHLKGQANIANTVNFSNSPDNQMQGLQKFQAASVLIKVSSEVSRMMQVVEQTLSPCEITYRIFVFDREKINLSIS